MITIDNQFDYGDIVYLKTDVDQEPHIVTSIQTFRGGDVIYHVRNNGYSSSHYEFELSPNKDILLTTTN